MSYLNFSNQLPLVLAVAMTHFKHYSIYFKSIILHFMCSKCHKNESIIPITKSLLTSIYVFLAVVILPSLEPDRKPLNMIWCHQF